MANGNGNSHETKLKQAVIMYKRLEASEIIGRIVATPLILNNSLSIEDMLNLCILYPDWSADINYLTNDIIVYNDNLYIVLQDHVSTAEVTPEDNGILYLNKTI